MLFGVCVVVRVISASGASLQSSSVVSFKQENESGVSYSFMTLSVLLSLSTIVTSDASSEVLNPSALSPTRPRMGDATLSEASISSSF